MNHIKCFETANQYLHAPDSCIFRTFLTHHANQTRVAGEDPGIFLTGLHRIRSYDFEYNPFVWSLVNWSRFRPRLRGTCSASDLVAESSPPNPAIKDQLRDIKNERRRRMTSIITCVVYLSNKELTIEIFYPLHTQTPHKQVFRNRFIPNFLRPPLVRQVCKRFAAIFNQ